MVIKLIRRVMPGINPEVEMVRHLTENGYANTPPLLGEIAMFGADGSGHTMIVAQRFVHNQGDAWQWTLDYLARFIETIGVGGKILGDEADQRSGYATLPAPSAPAWASCTRCWRKPTKDAVSRLIRVTPAIRKTGRQVPRRSWNWRSMPLKR